MCSAAPVAPPVVNLTVPRRPDSTQRRDHAERSGGGDGEAGGEVVERFVDEHLQALDPRFRCPGDEGRGKTDPVAPASSRG